MKHFVLAIATLALVASVVSAAPALSRTNSQPEERLLDLLSRYLSDKTDQADNQPEEKAAVVEELAAEHEQEDQLVEKEEDGLEEGLLKAVNLKKKDKYISQKENLSNREQEMGAEERKLTEELEADLEKKETEIMDNLERELLMLELKDLINKKASGGVPLGGK